MIALDDFSTLNEDDPDAWALSKHLISSSLPRRNVSCVRQLLDESECCVLVKYDVVKLFHFAVQLFD